MHYRHIIMVTAENEDEAMEEAASAIEPYGEGNVWDYYDVGGRWTGYFNGKNVVGYKDDPALFMKELEGVQREQQETFSRYRRRVAGIPPVEAPSWINGSLETLSEAHGEKTEASIRWLEREAEEVVNMSRCWNEVLQSEQLSQINDDWRLYAVAKLLDLVRGRYTTDAMFKSSESARADQAIRTIEQMTEEEKEHLYLVVMDLHN